MLSSTSMSIFALSLCQAITATIHIVSVGETGLTFSPDSLNADVGDLVQFQFYPRNHSVVQSTFAEPCVRSGSQNRTAELGFSSGYMPTLANATTIATYTIAVNDTKPIWMYCSQAQHCQSGMVMAINAPTTGHTFASFQSKAKANSTTATSSAAVKLVSTTASASTTAVVDQTQTVSAANAKHMTLSLFTVALCAAGGLSLKFLF